MLRTDKRWISWMVAIGVSLGTAGDALSQEAGGRAAARQQIEARIAQLEERATRIVTTEPVAEMRLDVARRQTELARKLLARNNQRAARVIADQAERMLKSVEPQEAAQ